MKYYLLSNSTDNKIVGKEYIQTKPGILSEKSSPAYRGNLTNEYFNNTPPILDLEIENKSKLTDIVSVSNVSAKGIFMNEKTKTIFEKFNIMNHKFYNGTLNNNGTIIPYYWLHIVNNTFDGIKLSQSSFYEADFLKDKIRDVSISSIDDYKEKLTKMEGDARFILPKELILTEDLKQLDILYFPLILGYLIVSEKVINELQENKIMGYDFTPTSIIIN